MEFADLEFLIDISGVGAGALQCKERRREAMYIARTWPVVGASILALTLGAQQAAAIDRQYNLLPVADGDVFDGIPFDGAGDGAFTDSALVTFLNPGLFEERSAIEFDLRAINPRRIKSAFLQITPIGWAIPSGTQAVPVQLYGYHGNGSIEASDFTAGSLITGFDALATPLNVSISLDVTGFLQGIDRDHWAFVGFGLRADDQYSQMDFGSLDLGPPATLVLTLK